jgi:hypothetical protein
MLRDRQRDRSPPVVPGRAAPQLVERLEARQSQAARSTQPPQDETISGASATNKSILLPVLRSKNVATETKKQPSKVKLETVGASSGAIGAGLHKPSPTPKSKTAEDAKGKGRAASAGEDGRAAAKSAAKSGRQAATARKNDGS